MSSRLPLRGLDTFQLKLIALVCMTLDHLAAFGWRFALFEQHYTVLRTVGRIAAPLFLFALVQGARHTRSRRRFLLRLYLAGMAIDLFVTATNFFLGERLGVFTPGNIVFTFFYVVLLIELLEGLGSAVKLRSPRAAAYAALLAAAVLVPHALSSAIYDAIPAGTDYATLHLIYGLTDSFLPSLFRVEYGVGFVLLGVALYFAKTKRCQCIVYAAFCLLCIAGSFLQSALVSYDPMIFARVGSFCLTFFDPLQCKMWLALPFMLLYNGERGRGSRWFFYWYYPLHRYAIYAAAVLFGG